MTRACADCATPISKKATRCRDCSVRHVNSRTDVAEARTAAIRAKFADPKHLAKMQAAARHAGEVARRDPAYREWLVRHGKRLAATALATPEARAAYLATGPARGAKRTDTVLGWCPPGYRNDYRVLARKAGATAARRMIEEQVEADEAKRLANLSPFERQEMALRNGAKLVPNVRVAVR